MSGNGRILSAAWSPYGGQVVVGIPLNTETHLEEGAFLRSIDPSNGILVIIPTVSFEQLQSIASRCAISLPHPAQVGLLDAAMDKLRTQDSVSEVLQQFETLSSHPRNACIDDLIAIAEVMQR